MFFYFLLAKMKLIPLLNYDEVSRYAAKYVAKVINEFKPSSQNYFNLGLPTGSTPLGMYRELIKLYKEGKISFEFVRTFNMDEYVGIDENHPESYHSFMQENFFKHINIKPENTNILNGNANNLDEECASYEKKIKQAGGIRLFIGGIGSDGHIAFNEPGSSLTSRTRVKTLTLDTVQANSRFFNNDISLVPKQALTVGVGTVMDAKEVLILVTGSQKANALKEAIEGGISTMCTSSIFQMHENATFVCDDDATLEIKVKTLKYFTDLMKIHKLD